MKLRVKQSVNSSLGLFAGSVMLELKCDLVAQVIQLSSDASNKVPSF